MHEVSGVIGLSKKLEIAKTHPRVSVSEKYVYDISLDTFVDNISHPFSYIGVAKFNRKIFSHLSLDPNVSGVLSKLVADGKKLGYIEYDGDWIHIATPEDLNNLRNDR